MPVYDASEIGLLQAGFNDMVHGLRERERVRDLFGRHVGEDVAEQALVVGAELGGEVRDVAVVFIDVVGSTEMAADTVRRRKSSSCSTASSRSSSRSIAVTADRSTSSRATPRSASSARRSREDAAGDALAAAREMSARLLEELPELAAGVGVAPVRPSRATSAAPSATSTP